MSGHQTPEEVRAEYVEKMGDELGQLFHRLVTELTWTHWRWHQFEVLYGAGRERFEFLNRTAAFFFYLLQKVLFEDVVLAIARLVDKESTFGKGNLTVRRLPTLIDDNDFASSVSALVDETMQSAAFATDWRHRHLAHRDLDLALRRTAKPLATATRRSVDGALETLRRCLNAVQAEFTGSRTGYGFPPGPGDARTLLGFLEAGELRIREREEAWDKGEAHPDDLDAPSSST